MDFEVAVATAATVLWNSFGRKRWQSIKSRGGTIGKKCTSFSMFFLTRISAGFIHLDGTRILVTVVLNVLNDLNMSWSGLFLLFPFLQLQYLPFAKVLLRYRETIKWRICSTEEITIPNVHYVAEIIAYYCIFSVRVSPLTEIRLYSKDEKHHIRKYPRKRQQPFTPWRREREVTLCKQTLVKLSVVAKALEVTNPQQGDGDTAQWIRRNNRDGSDILSMETCRTREIMAERRERPLRRCPQKPP